MVVALGLTVEAREGARVVTLSGELDLATAPELRERLHRVLADGCPLIVLDLDEVGFLDSSAIGVLVGTRRRARQADGEVALVCTAPRILRVLELTGLDRAFPTYPSLSEALAVR